MITEELLTVQDASQALGVSEDAVLKAIRRNGLPCVEKYGRKLIARADLEEYRQRTQPDGQKRFGRPRRTVLSERPMTIGELTTQAAMAGPIAAIWDTPEEDEAWKHLTPNE